MRIEPADLPELTAALSLERLGKLIKLTRSPAEAIALHQKTLRLSAALMFLTATIEIALRNTISDNLHRHFGVVNWLQQPPISFRWRDEEIGKIKQAIDSARRSEYAKLSQAEKTTLDALAYPNGRPAKTPHAQRARKKREHIQVSNGKVIAELTLFFWKRLYGPEYDHSLWKPTLKRTFPDKSLARATVASKLEQIYQSRNRLAHHEPVVQQRFTDTVDAIEFVARRLGQTAATADSPLAHLLADDIVAIHSAEASLRHRINAYQPP